MKIEVADTVELNNGWVCQVDRMSGNDPDHINTLGYGPFVINGLRYHQNGRFGEAGFSHSTSVKRIPQKASSDKLWREMTDEEKDKVPDDVLNDPANPLRIPWNEWSRAAKGALLLADNEGKAIQWYDFDFDGAWVDDKDFIEDLDVYDDLPYRIKPESVRETVTLMIDDGSMGGPRAIGTIDLIDGEPDRASIKMEKI